MDVLDTQARTRERFGRGPFSTRLIGWEVLARAIPALAKAIRKPPRGLEQVIGGLTRKQLAFLVLRILLDEIDRGWLRKGKKPPKNPFRACCQQVGRRLRDELEFAGLLAAKRWVKSAKNKHAALGKFRRIDWTNAECARAGDWLIACAQELDLFALDDRGRPKIADGHQAAINELIEDLVFRHPSYAPSLTEPPPWTSWRTDYDDRISATFVKTDHPETAEAIKAAFADGSIAEHASAVNAVQRVPLKVNPITLSLLRYYGGEEYRRDVVVADALLGKPFWTPIRCDFRGRFVHLCDLNYTRGDPIRSLFMFHEGKKVGGSIAWLEIAIANAYGIPGTWQDRLQWVADKREFIKAVANAPSLIWLQQARKPKEPFLFAAACHEYVAADTHGREYITHLPIWLDATSNGLQHLAMMRGDKHLAEMVNLNTSLDGEVLYFESPQGFCDVVAYTMDVDLSGKLPTRELLEWKGRRGDHCSDIYKILVKHVRFNLYADRDNPLSKCWLDRSSDDLRKVIKTPVMTLMYGVTKPGMLDQIKEAAEELYGTVAWEACRHLRDHVWRAIAEVIPIAFETRDHIQEKIVKGCTERGVFMEWTSPTGFPISNRYRESKTTRVKLPFADATATIADGYTDKIKKGKAKDAGAANFTHALDAAHLVRSINAAAVEGISALSVHDCYGAVAPDVARFAQIRRGELAHMYYFHDPLTDLHERNLGKGDPPKSGGLNVVAVGFSEYSDR